MTTCSIADKDEFDYFSMTFWKLFKIFHFISFVRKFEHSPYSSPQCCIWVLLADKNRMKIEKETTFIWCYLSIRFYNQFVSNPMKLIYHAKWFILLPTCVMIFTHNQVWVEIVKKNFSFYLPFWNQFFIISNNKAANAYIAGVPASNPYNPYFAPGQLVPTLLGPDPSNGTATVSPQMTQCVSQAVPMPQQQKLPRSDRIEVSSLIYIYEF